MKISILTATYNRAKLLENLYNSIVNNLYREVEIEWLIMDDGSSDETELTIQKLKEDNKIDIKYFKQENQGKMTAINNLMKYVKGDLVLECDSDDCFYKDAFRTINEAYKETKNENDLYAICFLKFDKHKKNIGKIFNKEKTTMFDLYFKEEEDGEKALVFFSEIRKHYKYELEKNEKFITEARLHHKMDLDYKIKCFNEPIMICEYQKDGYTKNIEKVFKENPVGYYKYFQEILQRDMAGVKFKKRLYVIKHYILFTYLAKNKMDIKHIRDFKNKILFLVLYIPGILKSKKRFK